MTIFDNHVLITFVCRQDVFAVADVGDPTYRPVRSPLSAEVLNKHLEGKLSVGTYLVRPNTNDTRVTCLDIDSDLPDLAYLLAREATKYVPESAVAVERTGGRGWHVWILYENWVPALVARNLGRAVVRSHVSETTVEIFPKGVEVGSGKFGTLVRLPLGRHPRTGNPSRVFSVAGDDISDDLQRIVPAPGYPKLPQAQGSSPSKPLQSRRGWPCIQALLEGVGEGERDNALFALACHFRDQGLPQDIVLTILRAANIKNRPPLGDEILVAKVASAFSGNAKIGCSTPVLAAHCNVDRCRMAIRRPTARRTWDANTLVNADLPPIYWVIPNVLPMGLGILAGKPKIGKSWLALQLAIAVGSGTSWLGYPVNHSPVLYLALEDGPARLQKRLARLGLPDNTKLQLELEFPRFGEGGEDLLSEILDDGYRGEPFRLIILDSLARAKSGVKEELSVEDMEFVIRPLQALGLSRECLILVVHHHRKAATGDVVWDTRGSGAIAGIADIIIGVYRTDREYRLVTRSRDAPELDLWLTFSDGLWSPVSAGGTGGKTTTERDILTLLTDRDFTARELATLRGVSDRATRKILDRLVERGIIQRVGPPPYRYSLVNESLDTLVF